MIDLILIKENNFIIGECSVKNMKKLLLLFMFQ